MDVSSFFELVVLLAFKTPSCNLGILPLDGDDDQSHTTHFKLVLKYFS